MTSPCAKQIPFRYLAAFTPMDLALGRSNWCQIIKTEALPARRHPEGPSEETSPCLPHAGQRVMTFVAADWQRAGEPASVFDRGGKSNVSTRVPRRLPDRGIGAVLAPSRRGRLARRA
jgi:hypothetical protein